MVPLFGAANASPKKGTTILYWFWPSKTVLNPLANGKIQGLWVFFKYFSKQILFSRTFQDSPLYSSTFQACANPGTVNVLNISYIDYGKYSKITNTFLLLFTNKFLVIRAGMLARTAYREDPDQTASSEAVWSESALFVKAYLADNSVQNFSETTSKWTFTWYNDTIYKINWHPQH